MARTGTVINTTARDLDRDKRAVWPRATLVQQVTEQILQLLWPWAGGGASNKPSCRSPQSAAATTLAKTSSAPVATFPTWHPTPTKATLQQFAVMLKDKV